LEPNAYHIKSQRAPQQVGYTLRKTMWIAPDPGCGHGRESHKVPHCMAQLLWLYSSLFHASRSRVPSVCPSLVQFLKEPIGWHEKRIFLQEPTDND